ncbi:MAG: response regulator [Proteobacteria bacterium]|nr:response regulator [Pseudomonadota bacterium]
MITESIMVIDDDQDLRDSMVEILEANGYQVMASETAEAGLLKMADKVPRLVLVDNMMPGMGGMALIPLVRKDYPGTKIIMITAFSTVDNAVAAMKSGADDYLTKPFRRDDLLMAVRRTLEMAKFEHQQVDPDMDEALACLANQIRRQILATLAENGEMRFMDITRTLGISDHTKVNFHLKNLKAARLVTQNREKIYRLTPQGKKIFDCLHLLAKRFSS